MSTNKQHKDRLFKFIFGNEERKEWTLSLYNALNDSDFTDTDDVEFNTIEDAVYMGMKNDVSFIIAFTLSIWEHQSTFNPNLPLRIFLYAAHVLEKHIAGSKAYRYGTRLVKLPMPKCLCFYNGLQEQPDEVILKLSDAFDGTEPDVELKVRMININYGHNEALMKKCRPLYEYAWFIDAIRRQQKVMKTLDEAVDAAVNEVPADFLLKKFLIGHRAEVKGMFLTEWDEDEAHDYYREEGRAEGREEEREAVNTRVASDMLREKMPLSLITKISRLSEEAILNLAKSLGVAVI